MTQEQFVAFLDRIGMRRRVGPDVERLAQALVSDGNNDPEMWDLLGEPSRGQARRRAERLIAEYRRLSKKCAACSLPAVKDGYCAGHARLGEYRTTDESHWAANE